MVTKQRMTAQARRIVAALQAEPFDDPWLEEQYLQEVGGIGGRYDNAETLADKLDHVLGIVEAHYPLRAVRVYGVDYIALTSHIAPSAYACPRHGEPLLPWGAYFVCACSKGLRVQEPWTRAELEAAPDA